MKNICIKCGVDLVEKEGAKFICKDSDCRGIVLSNETLKEFANKQEFGKPFVNTMPMIKQDLDYPYEQPNIISNWLDKNSNSEMDKQVEQDYSSVHLRHCYQGEYEDGCKYGEDDCPAKSLDEPKQDKIMERFIANAKQQEILEEVALKEYPKDIRTHFSMYQEEVFDNNGEIRSAFIDGAKWQQERSYSEEEVKEIIIKTVNNYCTYFSEELKNKIAEE